VSSEHSPDRSRRLAWFVVALTLVAFGASMVIVGISARLWYLWVAGVLLQVGALRTIPYVEPRS